MEKQRLQWEHKELHQQVSPHPPASHNAGVREYTMARERALRTQEWMPGRPKGGRSYKEAARDPILKDVPDAGDLEENERRRQEYYEEQKEVFNNVFQTYPDPRAQVSADREWMNSREGKIKTALHKRMVREGGYDPITLRDRRTGSSVGPLPDDTTRHKVNTVAGSLATKHRTGANVAYALGSDRYGDPDGGSGVEVKVQGAQVDHVTGIMYNEGRVDAGYHDLEER